MAHMDARVLQQKLQVDHAHLFARVRELDLERGRLTLPAHSGDAAAKKRLGQIRTELAGAQPQLGELVQAIEDLAPQVREQRDREQREALEQVARQVNHSAHEMVTLAERMDTILAAAAEVAPALSALMSEVQTGMGQLTAQRAAPGDVGGQAINRMLAVQALGFRPLDELLLDRLVTLNLLNRELTDGFSPKSPPLAQSVAEIQFAVGVKTKDVLDRADPFLGREPA